MAFLHQFVNGILECLFLLFGQVILLILAENHQQKDLPISLYEKVKVSETSPFPFSPCRVRCPGLSNPTGALYNFSAGRILQEIALDFQQHVIRVLFRKRWQALRENRQIDEL
jgi:hypothetical protein